MTRHETMDDRVRDLEHRAEDLQSKVELAPRAFVVEFAGTPKSGKSTSVEAIRHFFKRHGFGVHVLTERAAQCPIPMKGHLFFNTWCAATMLAELLENVDTKTDIVIADRGLFDSLIWFQSQAKRGELSDRELEHIENFLLMDRWKNLFDLVVVLRASAREALRREYEHRITRRPGSIMNESMLETLSDAVADTVDHYKNEFKSITVIDTDNSDELEVNATLLRKILDGFESFVNPKILVVPREALESLLSSAPSAYASDGEAGCLEKIIEESGEYLKRADVESNPKFIQIVTCGALLYEGRVFVFERQDRNPKSNLYGKSTIWQGCHVVCPVDERRSLSAARKALQARIAQSLFITRQLVSRFVGYAWDDSGKGDGRHLGLIFRLEVDSQELAESLRKKQFRRGRGHSLLGDFSEIGELVSSMDKVDLEPWSRSVLRDGGECLREEV